MEYRERMEMRTALLKAIRTHFDSQGFLEVDTPVAITAPAPEPYIEAPQVTLNTPEGPKTRYLQTSPELPMKRILAAGFDAIYQLAPAFRDGDLTPVHRPEFRILEWYRKDADWTALIHDCQLLLRACSENIGRLPRFQGRPVSLDFEQLTVDEAFQRHAGFSILGYLDRASLVQKVREIGIAVARDDSWNDLFHRVFLDRVEPHLLSKGTPVFLTHYPAPLASLAQTVEDDPRVAERFELYMAGMEIANGFGELVDPVEQRSRFVADRAQRLGLGMADYPVDERFFDALDTLPPCAGIALGFDRLVLAFVGAGDLDATAFLRWEET
ncbi:MAG: EF-P lysine aminoacylase EpmA [Myxococcota bacterium]